MGEVVNVIVAFAVIVLVFRWVTSSACQYNLQLLFIPLESHAAGWNVDGMFVFSRT